MANTPFPVQATLVAASGMYRNTRLIAEEVLPRVAPIGTQAFTYQKHSLADGYTIPDTKVGRTGRPAQLTFSATETPGATVDYGLDVPVPNADRANAAVQADAGRRAAMDPETKATLLATSILMLDREVRVANAVHSVATYPASQRTTLSGTSQWSDYTNSNPVDAVLSAMDTMVMRPNVGVIGRPAFTKLCQHPKVVGGILGNGGTIGVATVQAIAALLGLQKIVVGEAFVNTARPGQAVSLSRAWGKHMALLYIDENGGPFDMPSFGYTVQWGERIAGVVHDPNMGIRGGDNVRVGESVAEVIASNDMGYFFQNVVA